jgi:hypothetical protein
MYAAAWDDPGLNEENPEKSKGCNRPFLMEKYGRMSILRGKIHE